MFTRFLSNSSLQFFYKDDQNMLIVTTDTLSKFSLTKFLMENFDSDNGPLDSISDTLMLNSTSDNH